MVGRVLLAAGVMLGLPYPPVDMGPGLLYAPPEPLPALQIIHQHAIEKDTESVLHHFLSRQETNKDIED